MAVATTHNRNVMPGVNAASAMRYDGFEAVFSSIRMEITIRGCKTAKIESGTKVDLVAHFSDAATMVWEVPLQVEYEDLGESRETLLDVSHVVLFAGFTPFSTTGAEEVAGEIAEARVLGRG